MRSSYAALTSGGNQMGNLKLTAELLLGSFPETDKDTLLPPP